MASHLRRTLFACARTQARLRCAVTGGGGAAVAAAVAAGVGAGAAAGLTGGLAYWHAPLAVCEPAPSSEPPPAEFYGDAVNDPVARNLEVDVARVNEWKKSIAEAREAWKAGERGRAESALRRALEQARYFGERGPPVATSLFNLAELLRKLGGRRREEALELYERALDIFETTAGPAHRTTTTCMTSLADLHAEAGAHTKSRALLGAAAERLRSAVGEEPRRSPALAATLLRLGDAQQQLGELEGAQKTFEETHALCAQLWGATHARTVPARARLAEVLLARGLREEAARVADEALVDAATDAQRQRLHDVCRRAR